MNDVNEKLIVALIGLVSGFLGAAFKLFLESRVKLDESARAERWKVYKVLWALTKAVPMWPRNKELTYGELLELSKQCRNWYFTEGGIHLSEKSKTAYGNMQEALQKALGENNQNESVGEEDYCAVQKKCTALRTELTCDLHSRQRGAF